MSEKPIEKCCGTCVHGEPYYRKIKCKIASRWASKAAYQVARMNLPKSVTLPDIRIMQPDDGDNCTFFISKPETQP